MPGPPGVLSTVRSFSAPCLELRRPWTWTMPLEDTVLCKERGRLDVGGNLEAIHSGGMTC